jgi:hypothetical protein
MWLSFLPAVSFVVFDRILLPSGGSGGRAALSEGIRLCLRLFELLLRHSRSGKSGFVGERSSSSSMPKPPGTFRASLFVAVDCSTVEGASRLSSSAMAMIR